MEDEHVKMMSNLRSRRKKSTVGIICCFTGTTHHHHRRASFDASSYSSAPVSHPSPRWSPGWFKSKNTLDHTPEMKGKCRSFISRIGRHRRHASAEFNYDPLSYSLNFAEDVVDDDESHVMSFSARFSAVSPRRTPHAYDHHSPTLRSPERWRVEAATPPIMEEGHLSRGFESLAENMKTQRRNKSGLSSPSPAAGEEVNTPVGISSNREILVQMC